MPNTDELLDLKILELIKSNPIKSICDYGCGEGGILKRLSDEIDKKIILTGIDYLKWWPEDKRPKTTDRINFIDKESEDFTSLCNSSQKYDLIISTFALHHYRYPIKELKIIENLTTNKGFLLIADLMFDNFNDKQIVKNISSYIGEMFAAFRGKYHRHHYTLEEAKDLLSAINIQVKEALSEKTDISDKELQEEVEHSMRHSNHMLELLTQVKNPILEDFFKLNISYEKGIVEKHKFDYSSILIVTGQKL